MALTNNPNKTKGIEKRWNREITRRFRALTKGILEIPLVSVVTNVDAAEQAQIDSFMQQFNSLSFLTLMSDPWQNKYQEEAYVKSIDTANAEIKSQTPITEQIEIPLIAGEGTALVQLSTHRNELDFLKRRANDSLLKWTNQLSGEINSILHENMGRLSTGEINKLMAQRIGVTSSRARTIAATEIAQAAQRARITHASELESDIGEPVNVRWVTVNDSRVRHLHATWHGKIFTQDQAAERINVSPWNCRCGLRIAIEGRSSARINARFARERKTLLEQEKKSNEKV